MTIGTLSAARNALTGAAAAAALAACGGANQPLALYDTRVGTQDFSVTAKRPALVAVPNRGKSSMSHDITGPLLYVADSLSDDVFAYRWPDLRLIGNLTGFKYPQGECVDGSGNVWITNTARSNILEFARGGLTPIKTLDDPGWYPVSCAIDYRTGDLAVANIFSRSHGPGSVSIYKKAAGNPKIFSDSALQRMYFDDYDGQGNLYVDGFTGAGTFTIVKFDGKNFQTLTVSGATINFPGAVQVKGGHIDIEDQLAASGISVMYQTTLKGTTLTVDATAQFSGSVDCVGTYIYGKAKRQMAICPDAGTPSINVYKFPAGGNPTSQVTTGLMLPSAAVVTP